MNIFLLDDESLPTLPITVRSYLYSLVQQDITFNEVYVPIEKEVTIYVYNDFNVILTPGGRVLNDEYLINEIQNWYNTL